MATNHLESFVVALKVGQNCGKLITIQQSGVAEN